MMTYAMVSWILVNFGSGYDLLLDGTKPQCELTCCQSDPQEQSSRKDTCMSDNADIEFKC